MDIATIQENEGFDLNILHPLTAKPTDMIIKIASYAGKLIAELQRKIMADIVLKKEDKLSSDEYALRISAALIISWKNIQFEGKEFLCTEGNKLILLRKFHWIAKQIDAAAQNIRNFIKA